MQLLPTSLPGVVIVEPKVFGDARGWFYESFSQPKFEAGLQALGALVMWRMIKSL